eukprot:8135020-Alexandrium_andersonii.AAC.1
MQNARLLVVVFRGSPTCAMLSLVPACVRAWPFLCCCAAMWRTARRCFGGAGPRGGPGGQLVNSGAGADPLGCTL